MKEQSSLKVAKPSVKREYAGIAKYVGDWALGLNKEKVLGNIHRNLLGVDKLGKIRPIEDLAYFMLVCRQYNLNPLKKEIYAVYQRTKVNGQWVEKLEPIVSIHGLRQLARRSKNPTYAYTGKAVFDYKDTEKTKLDSATVEVFGRFDGSFEAVKIGEYTAYYDEFAKTHASDDEYGKYRAGDAMGTWKTMPRVMLAKCAEANAIRSIFDIGGVYVEEEMSSNGDRVEAEVIE
ncbi:recombinase RecT [Candidatus Saccharibacteria bacterium]|nr:recombinase RecT [Candidatus Saccharibacteria bacterium]